MAVGKELSFGGSGYADTHNQHPSARHLGSAVTKVQERHRDTELPAEGGTAAGLLGWSEGKGTKTGQPDCSKEMRFSCT